MTSRQLKTAVSWKICVVEKMLLVSNDIEEDHDDQSSLVCHGQLRYCSIDKAVLNVTLF